VSLGDQSEPSGFAVLARHALRFRDLKVSADLPSEEVVDLATESMGRGRADGRKPSSSILSAMLRIGLTGGIASGKSTVARHLSRLGAAVVDADAIVRALYAPGGAGEAAARELFGEEIVSADGSVDRVHLAQIVFADPARRHALESRIHPLVGEEIMRRFAEAEKAGTKVAVAEASQLLEARTQARYDRVVAVVAPEELRLERWAAGGGDIEDARRRMAAQLSAEEAASRADDVIVNDGTPEELQRKVEALYRDWTRGPAR
jgi:dephospho-CoA kinase